MKIEADWETSLYQISITNMDTLPQNSLLEKIIRVGEKKITIFFVQKK